MARFKQLGMAAGTFSVALGIGFVMQNGDALASRFGGDASATGPAPFTADAPAGTAQVSNAVLEPEATPAPAEIVPVNATTAPDLTEMFADVGTAEAEVFAGVPDLGVDLPEAIATDNAANGFDVAAVSAPEQMSAQEITPEMIAAAERMPSIPSMSLTGLLIHQGAGLVNAAYQSYDSHDPSDNDNVEYIDVVAAPEAEAMPVTADALDCTPEMVGVVGAGATVKVAVTAPCNANEPFTVHHQGMMFTAMIDEDGRATAVVPALAEVAVIIAAFENGDGATVVAEVADFASYDRAVLQWQGDASVMLSAYEGGAGYGDTGHIHTGNPGNLTRLTGAEGGYLMRLGDGVGSNALSAEVYTFPSASAALVSEVMLVAEAEITPENCGQDLSAQSIQVSPSGESSALDLTMVMPACDAVGDILILQNMFEDLTIAMR